MIMAQRQFIVPKFVQEILSRSEYAYGPESEPGYSLKIHKRSIYANVSSLKKEVERFCSWADRNTPEGLNKSVILCVPKQNHYTDQIAIVTVYDPVMRQIEEYIKDSNK